MIEGIEGYYQTIADAMLEAIPEDWTSATFNALFYEGSSTYEAEYVRACDGLARSFSPTDAGDQAIRQMRKKFRESGKPVWGSATFELRPDGKFSMQFSYDDCDQNGNLKFDEEKELQRFAARRNRLSQT